MVLLIVHQFRILDIPDEGWYIILPFVILVMIISLVKRAKIMRDGGEEAAELRKEMYEHSQKYLKFQIVFLVGMMIFLLVFFPLVFMGPEIVYSLLSELKWILILIGIILTFIAVIWFYYIFIKLASKHLDIWKLDKNDKEAIAIRKEINKKVIPPFILTFLGIILIYISLFTL